MSSAGYGSVSSDLLHYALHVLRCHRCLEEGFLRDDASTADVLVAADLTVCRCQWNVKSVATVRWLFFSPVTSIMHTLQRLSGIYEQDVYYKFKSWELGQCEGEPVDEAYLCRRAEIKELHQATFVDAFICDVGQQQRHV